MEEASSVTGVGDTEIANDERLSRFIMKSDWVRKSNNTVRLSAFLPEEYNNELELSLVRHINLSVDELWRNGEFIAGKREKKLLGRADLTALNIRNNSLDVYSQADPPIYNHAVVKGWSQDKSYRKMIAAELALAAGQFLPNPL